MYLFKSNKETKEAKKRTHKMNLYKRASLIRPQSESKRNGKGSHLPHENM